MNQQKASFGSTRPIIPAGTQLNGIYEIDAPIAAGGMGEVYRGHTIQTGDLVAIKLIRSDLAEAEAALALFRKEASALHNLNHPAIVRYYVFTIDPVLQRPYLAMEYVDGQSLSTMLRGGPLAYEAVHRLMQRVAAGLQAAHEGGVVHRDISPDNIIIPGGDMAKAKIIDFGIARSTHLGEEGTVIGTGFAGKYNYVSPEQLGLFGGDVSPRSDIYSLGLVLAEALRQRPIDMGGNHVEVIEKRRRVPDLSDVDARIRPLLEHMLQPNPDDRPASMAEVAIWPLDPTPKDRGRRDKRNQIPQPIPEPFINTRTVLLGGIGLAAAIVVGFGVSIVLHPPKKITDLPKVELHATASQQKPARLADVRPKPSQGTISGLAPPKNISKMEVPPAADDAEIAEIIGPQQPSPLLGRARLEAVTRYINRYQGGDCFFIEPVAINDRVAAIEGFGTSLEPFRVLDDAFRKSNGFEADIGVQIISLQQCPALTFLSRLRNSGVAPKLDVAATHLKAGQSLTGTVTGLGPREAEVLLVSADGQVQSIPTKRANPSDDSASFNAVPTDAGPELLLAVASPKPLQSLRQPIATAAEQLFPKIFADAERDNLGLGASLQSINLGP